MNQIVLLPLIIPFFTAIACILAWQRIHLQRYLALGGSLALLCSAIILLFKVKQEGILLIRVGDWPAPFGIVLIADLFSAIMVLLAAITGFVVVIYSLASIDEQRTVFGYYPVLMVLLMGIGGAFITGDIFNLYVWYEIILISSFVLLALGGQRAQLEASIKYFALNLLVSAFFLSAIGILYGMAGTLNMADLAITLRNADNPALFTTLSMLFLVAFAIKSAMFPFFFWLPAAYHTPPAAVTTLFSGLMTKVGVYSSVRIFTLIFVNDTAYTHRIILVLSAFTMLIGVLGAVAQYDFRRLLSFHIVSQIGYLMMGLGIFTVASLTGTIYFMAHVIVAKAALFLVSGVTYVLTETYDLKKLGSLYKGYPPLAILFFIPALALSGIPPLSGFWAKFALVKAGLEAEQYGVVGLALVVSILTLFSMTKIWAEAFWKDSPLYSPAAIQSSVQSLATDRLLLRLIPIIILVSLSVLMGLAAEPCLKLAQEAAAQLMNPQAYLQAVLGDQLS